MSNDIKTQAQDKDRVTVAELKDADDELLDRTMALIVMEKEARKRVEANPDSPITREEHERVAAELVASNAKLAESTSKLEELKGAARVEAEAQVERERQEAEAAKLGERAARKVPGEARNDLMKIVNGIGADARTPEEMAQRDAYAEAYKRISEGALLAKMYPTEAERLVYLPSPDDERRATHAAWDVYYAAAAMLSANPKRPDFQAADAFFARNTEFDVKGASELRKALDTATSTEGAELIPTAFSATLVDKLYLAMRVAGLFVRFTMPTDPYRWPVQTGFATAYRMSEALTDNQFFTSLVTPSTPTTTNVLFEAEKLAAATFWSDELTQDSIIAILPFVGDNVVLAISRAIETAYLNGSDDLTNLDNAAGTKLWTATADARNSWDGIRRQVEESTVTMVDGGTLTAALLRSTGANMGVYGVDPGSLAWIVGPKSLTLFLGLTEVITMEKFGPMATIVSGQLAQVDGKPVVPSEFIYENLNASAVYDATTTTKTMALLAHRRAFYMGDRRQVTLEQDRNILAGQNVMVGVWRGDMKSIWGTDKVANVLKNMA